MRSIWRKRAVPVRNGFSGGRAAEVLELREMLTAGTTLETASGSVASLSLRRSEDDAAVSLVKLSVEETQVSEQDR